MDTFLDSAPDTIKWYHHAVAAPLKLLAARNIGPLGGENAISVVIEAVLAKKKGLKVPFTLSKTDQFFVDQLTSRDVPDPMLEYRELNHLAQQEILRRRRSSALGVIWLGAGVFTLTHPLLAQRQRQDWHLWTDASPKIVEDALQVFEEMLTRGQPGHLSYDIRLPEDIGKLNHWIELISQHVQEMAIVAYGVTYALTMAENYAWLSQLELPQGMNTWFVFNAPGPSIALLPGIMAAFHDQRMVCYDRQHVAQLFTTAVPHSQIVWEQPREATRNKIWGTWLINRPG